MTSSSSNKAWITLATNDSYSLGALVLAHSLKAVKTVHKLAILITPGVTPTMKQKIEAVFDEVKVVDVLDSKDQTHLALMSRPELGVTFTKLHCWTFTNYEKCVFLDADTLVLQNCDELFDREEFSAAPDPGWPDCFNSGVFVYKPSQDTFGQLLDFARTRGSFDGGDQGLLNMFFKDWSHTDISKHLSFTYNVVWSSTYSYLPALKEFGHNMKIIHFIASSKPWLQSFNTETRLVTATSGGTGLQTLLQLWWDLFCHHVHPELSTDMGGLAGQFARVPLGEKTTDQKAVEDFLRRQSWEHGNMDYLGKDSFSNIWAKINETLGGTLEVKTESGVVKTPSPPEVVHTEEPKPLKSALKKTSTTIPPVESELIDSSEPLVKQLEKLDLSKDGSSQVTTPDTPTITSPTPPTTPATQVQDSIKSESVEPVKIAPISAQAVESVKTAPTPVQDVEPVKTIQTPAEAVELVKQIPKPVEDVEPSKEALKPTEAVEPVKTAPTPAQADEPVKTAPTPAQSVEPVKTAPTSAPVVEPVKIAPTPAQATEPIKTAPTSVPAVESVKTVPTPVQAVESPKETPKPAQAVESPKETPKPAETVESLKETLKPEDLESVESIKTTEPVKEIPILDKSIKEPLSSEKMEQGLPKSDEPVKQITKPSEIAQKPPSSTDAPGSLESNDPPVAPKRTNKGSPNVPKK